MRFHITCLAFGALALGGCTAVDLPSDLTNIQREEALLAAVVSPARPAEHIAQDAQRQPLETMLFAGVAEGQRIAEVSPGDGYYTRLLAQAVGSTGRIYVVLPAGDAVSIALFQPLAEQYGNIEIVSDLSELSLPEGLDVVWDVATDHDTDATAYAAALGEGGILYIERANAGNPIDDQILEYFAFDGQQDRADPPISGLKFHRR
ncbi:hypothetical protein [Aurantiacibacter sediminis]|uniref:Methyltransferase n=1 Tax=Aurantiacibacter sediminis TaxID=2793064 RepID=A0ABS0N4E3_9SPHN|nr:hypothetical protein [Aurantiacibacter sediminis]MBH5322803.1 hypothetical protein [Aurantiacibacter sediminis]